MTRVRALSRYWCALPERCWRWFCARAEGAHARRWLFGLSFAESVFFPIPVDALLIPILSAGVKRWAYYAFLTTLASVLGALFGYALGAFAFDHVGAPIVRMYGLTEEFAHVGTLYNERTFITVLTAAFTPIPFKVFVLSAGFFKVSLVPFVLASILGRAMRFYLVAYLAARFGARAAELFISYFNRITLVVVAVGAVAALLYVTIG